MIEFYEQSHSPAKAANQTVSKPILICYKGFYQTYMSTMHILCAHDSCIPSVTVQWTFKELKTWETTYHLCVMVESLF